MWVQSLGQEDPLEKGTVIHSSILAWRISWIEEPGGLQSMVSQRVGHGDCSHEIKRHLFLGRKAVTNLDSILKSRDITLLTNVSQSYGFSSSHVRL